MKPKYMAIVLLVAVLALLGTGCNKATGGGWFLDEVTDHKITFGFNAKPIDEPAGQGMIKAKGQFQLVDHDAKTKMHGTFNGTWDTPSNGTSTFAGTCSINGQDGVTFYVKATDNDVSGLDAEDHILIKISTSPEITYAGLLGGGNIKVHKE